MRAVLLTCALLCWMAPDARADIEPTTLGELAHHSEWIVIGEVDRIVEVPLAKPSETGKRTARLGRISVRKWVRGPGGRHAWFLADVIGEWEGNDISWANQGDQGLYLLDSEPIEELVVPPGDLIKIVGTQPVARLAFHGHGRMRMRQVAGASYVRIPTSIRTPPSLATIPGPDPRYASFRRSVPLWDTVGYLVRRLERPTGPAPIVGVLELARRAVHDRFADANPALEALRRDREKTWPVLVQLLTDPKNPWREDAALVVMRSEADELTTARSLLQSKNVAARRAGAFCLCFAYDHETEIWSDRTWPTVRRALGDPDPEVRRLLLAALSGLFADERLFPAITPLLEDMDATVRREAARAWAANPYFSDEVKPVVAPARAALLKLATDQGLDTRRAVWEALSYLGVGSDPARPMLGLIDKDPIVQACAVTALGRRGSTDDIKTLVHLLQREPATLRIAAAHALGIAKSPAAVPALIRSTADKDELASRLAIWALGEIGPAAKAAVPALEQILRTEPGENARYFECEDALDQIRSR